MATACATTNPPPAQDANASQSAAVPRFSNSRCCAANCPARSKTRGSTTAVDAAAATTRAASDARRPVSHAGLRRGGA